MKKILIFIFALVAVVACDKQEDTSVISKGKMEEVLYDYHVAQAMLDQLTYDEREKMAQAYIDAVFEKHDITEADFDSSIVYYNRHPDDLADIYNDLKERMDNENKQLALSTGNDVMAVTSQNGDTANIWNSSNLFVLRYKDGLNNQSFTINADSSFHQKDKFVLACKTRLYSETTDNNNNYIAVGLTINYKDGKTTGTTQRNTGSSNMQLTLEAAEGKDIASVSGFFYYNGNKEIRNVAFISNIGLVRMRTVKEEQKPLEVDSVKTDTVPTQTPEETHHERLTPEQMHEKSETGSHVQIKTAPDVRTPNSTFRRRRHVKK